ncbi:MAG: hypothetical protein EOO99_11545 [Pedobacter sp.]|nr:MAG: hypothetical protein EOO99_11545 [Pedobacter sp.]
MKNNLSTFDFNAHYGTFNIIGGRLQPVDTILLNNDHVKMRQYIDAIFNVIKDFNPGFDSTRAMALAKSGIVETNNFDIIINRTERQIADSIQP